MPESVNDRPTKAHEQVFLLAKRSRYFYDADAVREEQVSVGKVPVAEPHGRYERQKAFDAKGEKFVARNGVACVYPIGRNLRSVWSIASTPFPGSHFATFPIELAARCIKASTSERGVCGRCGAPWRRVVEREVAGKPETFCPKSVGYGGRGRPSSTLHEPGWRERQQSNSRHIGWQPTCPCGADSPVVPATVFDPFCGAATTLLAARQLGRHGIGVELNRDYIDLSLARLRQHTSGKPDGPRIKPLDGQVSLFDLMEGD